MQDAVKKQYDMIISSAESQDHFLPSTDDRGGCGEKVS